MNRPCSQCDGFALGRQMTVEFYDCDPKKLADAENLEKVFLQAAHESGATVVDSMFHQFLPQGVSGVVIISESHFAVHAWPEHDYAAVDLFTCGEKVDFDKAVAVIASGIGCREWVVSSLINRGIVGNNGIERLVPVVENRDCRAFQLSWKSRFAQTHARALSTSVDLYECSAFDFESAGAPEQFIRQLLSALELEPCGAFQLRTCGGCRDFLQPLKRGRISGSSCGSEKILYLDLFVKDFFDPRAAAEHAVALSGAAYYRMQPQVRE